MPTVLLPSFVEALRHFRVLDQAQSEEVVRTLLPRVKEPKSLARELIQRAWLTPFQANQVLQGKGQDLLLGSYVLLERLGEGGMGQVFKARNWKLGQIVALKLVHQDRLNNPQLVQRFHREIRVAAQLDHANIVRAYDADSAGTVHFLVMEFAPGMDLGRMVRQHGPLPVAQACDAIRQAALGLQHAAERGLVHRDIKPANLLLTGAGVLKLLDMGLARLDFADEQADDNVASLTRQGIVMGTVDYMAPEQAMNFHTADIRADLYSLGCTFYFLLVGRVPFPGGEALARLMRHRLEEPTPIQQLRPEVPGPIVAIVGKLMAKLPEDRYQTPAELVAALDAMLCEPVAAFASPSPSSTEELSLDTDSGKALTQSEVAFPSRTRKRRSTARKPGMAWILVGASAGVLVLLILVLVLVQPWRTSQPVKPETPKPSEAESSSALVSRLKPLMDQGAKALAVENLEGKTRNGLQVVLGDKEHPVRCVASHPDTQALAWALRDGTIRLVGPGERPARTARGGTGGDAAAPHPEPDQLQFSPDGRLLACSTTTKRLRLWIVTTGEPLLNPSYSNVKWFAFTADSKALLVWTQTELRRWDLAVNPNRDLALKGPSLSNVKALALAADGRTLALGGAGNTIQLWDWRASQVKQTLTQADKDVSALTFHPDGKSLISSTLSANPVKRWSSETGHRQPDLRDLSAHTCIAFSPRGTLLATGHGDGTVRLWDSDSGKHRDTLRFAPATGKIVQLAFLDERHLATVNSNGTLDVLQLPGSGFSNR